MNDRGRRADRISSPRVDTPGDVWSSPLPDPAVASSPLAEGEPDGGGFPELQLALPENLWPEEAAVVIDTPTGRIGALAAPVVAPPTLRPRPPRRSRRARSRRTVALAALASTAAVAVVGLVLAGASNRAPSQLQAGLSPSTVTSSIPRATVPAGGTAGVLGAATAPPTVAVDPATVPAAATGTGAAPSAVAAGAGGATTGVTATTRPVAAPSGATSPPASPPSPASAPPAAPAAAPTAPDRSVAPPVPSSVSPPAPPTPDVTTTAVTTTAVTQAPRRDRPTPLPEITTTTAPPPATGPTTTVVGPVCLGGNPLVPIPCD